MTDNAKRTGAAMEAHYQFLLWLMAALEKFPKSHKFTVGDRIETTALDVLEGLIEATYTRERDRRALIASARARIGRSRFTRAIASGTPTFFAATFTAISQLSTIRS
jgi:hypothetical protein